MVDTTANKERWQEIVKRTKKCGFCPRHDVENKGRRPRSDRQKNYRRKSHA